MTCKLGKIDEDFSPEERWVESINDYHKVLDNLDRKKDALVRHLSSINHNGEDDGKRYIVHSIWQEVK